MFACEAVLAFLFLGLVPDNLIDVVLLISQGLLILFVQLELLKKQLFAKVRISVENFMSNICSIPGSGLAAANASWASTAAWTSGKGMGTDCKK